MIKLAKDVQLDQGLESKQVSVLGSVLEKIFLYVSYNSGSVAVI